MPKDTGGITSNLLGGLCSCLRRCIFGILSMGPVPNHIAFIMDGNRRFAKKSNLAEGIGHKAGFSSLVSMLRYCYELGVKYATVYAFSIDNFKRKPKEVQSLMELMQEKIEELLQDESIINEYGVKLHFIGNLQLLAEPVRISMEKAMNVTAHNKQRVLLVCVAYTSSDEIVHAVEESFKELWNEVHKSSGATVSNGTIGQLDRSPKRNGIRVNAQDSCEDYARQNADGSTDRSGETEISSCNGMVEIAEEGKHDQGELPAIKLTDVEKNMYMAVAPDPDILIRTSGEVRLSNFLLWQTSTCPLYSPAALWPEIGLRHLIWAVLNFQRHHFYLEKKKKQF
ncbi:hypothetical protein HN51_045444 [Arachis hypogaea]|uniref:dehydrodolichyl diphosphate synthase 6 n=1 Tax=Arachis ipaensis TaxID=130454 RepID=UPI0007AFC92D|nr:dehydrodolichyl diphosphate synthase 6 [Arachis ipaensis]XP_016171714.1 dehydrodolichyl diphosphate synthase 6 [Arachis ipaensis]XP_025672719.1 dehydrodolichyl diphosphate synthase 6 [Arachis hypogaea]XP_025672720.1 dehydrodolichyl diphosphate synthase 6 [Arachis hypogaea]QHN97710.1 Dehydrodolichyl diphosphate synthase [Arachis hypogaea]QHN97711.1 Dehydrodolichyl diphosphate synthase [Arachis hypogaea]